MSFVMPIVAVSPMRKEAAHRSEMVSQLLFGEVGEVLETSGDFIRVRTIYDAYEGWCQKSQLVEIEELPSLNNKFLSKGWSSEILVDQQPMYLTMGTPLDFLKNGQSKLGGYEIEYKGKYWESEQAAFTADQIKLVSEQYLNTSYLWGGRTVFGIDCSGFAQQVYRHFGIKLPRDAYQQAALGEAVGFLQETQCGDLAFFDNPEGKITHVGILLSPNQIIHASAVVRIDAIDNMGIVNSKTGQRTHQLRTSRRYR